MDQSKYNREKGISREYNENCYKRVFIFFDTSVLFIFFIIEIHIYQASVLFIMGRKKGPNSEKIKKIRETLKKYPEGLWIRELARKSGIDKSAVSRYLTLYMKNEVRIKKIGNLIKIVRLKNR